MSVELTTTVDGLSIKPQKVHREEQATVDKGENADTKISSVLTAEEVQSLNKEDDAEAKDKIAQKELMTTPQLENVAKQLQEFIGTMNRGLEFIVDDDSGRDVIKVIDKNSGDIIKQYPTEEVLSLVAKLSEATGNFVDSKV